jgi:epoxyqueuosine reductase
MNPADQTEWVVERARELGFELCGVAAVERLEELTHLPEWLGRGYAGEMLYLHDARRQSPARALEGARSIIVCGVNYNTPLPYSTELPATGPDASPRGWISRYAWGDDYHDVLGERLDALLGAMRNRFREPFDARAYVDTGPVVERVAAKYAGLGWLAKNTCLINAELGSWLFLGVIITTLDLEPTLGATLAPPPDLCGNCRLCMDACPTGAIVEPYLLDARRCISYLTIELRGAIPEEFRRAMGRQAFGCDICQDVCPWNRNAPVTGRTQFLPREIRPIDETQKSRLAFRPAHGKAGVPGGVAAGGIYPGAAGSPASPADQPRSPGTECSLFAPSLEWLASVTEEEFRQVFRGSAVKRAKWLGMVRNASIALGNSGLRPQHPDYPRIVALLERLAASPDALIAEHARWALDRLRNPNRL